MIIFSSFLFFCFLVKNDSLGDFDFIRPRHLDYLSDFEALAKNNNTIGLLYCAINSIRNPSEKIDLESRALRQHFNLLALSDKDLVKRICPDLKCTSPDLKCANFQII